MNVRLGTALESTLKTNQIVLCEFFDRQRCEADILLTFIVIVFSASIATQRQTSGVASAITEIMTI